MKQPLRFPALAAVLLVACSPPIANREPVGEAFPTVRGEALDGTAWSLPEDLAGRPAILLVGFIQEAQFDLDRWLLGISQAEAPVPFLELPTIRGLAPRMLKRSIDDGMRSGIPADDWPAVVTLWTRDASRIVELTGNENPRNGRVLLLDGDGRIVWFADEGYSAFQMLKLDARARELAQRSADRSRSEPTSDSHARPG